VKLLIALLVTALVVLAAAAGLVWHWQHQPLEVQSETRIELLPGQSFGSFAESLASRGILDHPSLWTAAARLSGAARRIQAGEYAISPGDTPAILLERLLAGEVVSYEVALIEGWTVRQALQALSRAEGLTRTLAGVDESTLLGAIGLPAGHAEGLFLPDTYHYVRGDTDADILRRAYQALQEELREAWAHRDAGLPYQTPYEALIVASLIEKETAREEDRARIAQVFVARLQRGMRLQTDPSVIYGLGDAFDGNLTRLHLRTDTPYNTYTRKGLPPTPIALVSRRSILAALHPAEGEYLYFVSRGDGTSEFSASLEEHQAAVRKYQLR